MDEVFKALADKSRRRLLDVLFSQSGQCLNDLCSHLTMSRQAVMKHLRILEDANLVTTKWDGREKLHFLNPMPIQETFGRWIQKYQEGQLHALDSLKQALEAPQTKKSLKKRRRTE